MIMATGQIGAEEGSEKMASLLALSWLEPRKVVAATWGAVAQFQTLTGSTQES